jgi:hypothetical protein
MAEARLFRLAAHHGDAPPVLVAVRAESRPQALRFARARFPGADRITAAPREKITKSPNPPP